MWNWLQRILKLLAEAVARWLARCIPQYEPAAWNDADGVQFSNNCYNYACNMQTGTYAQPGSASGNMYGSLVCAEVHAGAVSDGLVPTDCDTGCGCRKCCHQVALVVWPGVDYHWYRRDRNGRWSHKMGGTPVTNLDNSGNIITDPRTADRGSYSEFCGCHCVCADRVTIS